MKQQFWTCPHCGRRMLESEITTPKEAAAGLCYLMIRCTNHDCGARIDCAGMGYHGAQQEAEARLKARKGRPAADFRIKPRPNRRRRRRTA